MKNTIIKKIPKLLNNNGISLVEILIALLISSILVAATFSFFITMHQVNETQYEISEIQNTCRASLWDIKKTLRNAGFKLSGHPSFEILTDTLAVYFSETQTVDTVLYYLQEFTDAQYAKVAQLPDDKALYNLMKKTNSDTPEIYSDFITDLSFTAIDAANITVSITALTTKKDEMYNSNGGFRELVVDDRIHLRNLNL